MNSRTRTIALIVVCLGCILALVYLGIKGNVMYYYKVSEAVKKADSQKTSRFRLAGAVVAGSIKSNGSTVTFKVTDGDSTATVIHEGDPPDLFKEGAPVVTEGHWQKGKLGKVFLSDKILIKHGNEYSPPTVKQKNTTTTSPL